MPTQGQSVVVIYTAWNTGTLTFETGDEANHALFWIKDGVSAAATNDPAEVDAVNARGKYSLVLTAAECGGDSGELCGTSSTADVVLVGVFLTFEPVPATAEAVWDLATSGHTTAGTFGEAATSVATDCPTADEIATAVATALSGTTITLVAPVITGGSRLVIYDGDDYVSAERAVPTWSSDSWPDLTAATVIFEAGTVALACVITDAGEATQAVSLDPLTAASTAALAGEVMRYTFFVLQSPVDPAPSGRRASFP